MKWLGVIAAALVALTTVSASGGEYPDKSIRLIVPYPAGGPPDFTARLLAAAAEPELGQTVVVENRPGAAASVGNTAALTSAPDGYTLLLGTPTLVIEPSLRSNLPYDARKDIAPIAMLVRGSFILVVRSDLPIKNFQEFVDYAKANPGKILMGSPGIGTTTHLATELLQRMAGIQLRHVPFQGETPAIAAFLANDLDAMLITYNVSRPHIESGKLRALAVTTAERSAATPDIPTIAESGLPGYQAQFWQGLFAPAGTPQAVLDRWNGIARKVLAEPDMKAKFLQTGLEPGNLGTKEFHDFFMSELDTWAKVAESAGLQKH